MSLVDEALELADKLIEKPDVPNDKLMPLMNRLAALALRLRYQGSEFDLAGDRKGARKHENLAKSLDQIISTLKYQLKTHLNSNGGENKWG
jgi:hypothetical protein